MMNFMDIERITEVLDAMAQYELLLSDFYHHNADVWTDDRALWNNLARAEIQHADNIQKMKDIIVKKKERFTIGRPFNLTALNTVTSGLKDATGRISSGGFSRGKMLIMARDIEQSIIESNYAEIVKTTDPEYNTLLKEILSQTYAHKKMIQEKIAEMKAKA